MLSRFIKSKYMMAVCIVFMIAAIAVYALFDGEGAKDVEYGEFLRMMEAGAIKSAGISGSVIAFEDNEGRSFVTVNPGSPDLKERMLLSGIEISGSVYTQKQGFVYGAVITLVVGGVFYLKKQKQTEVAKIQTMVGNETDRSSVDFTMVAGQEEVIEGLNDIVSYIKNPESYRKMGARMPKGVLLYGPPGTGKTLLAQAMAGEAQVPFISANGSDFVQMYVGVGAKRIREMFAKAREKKKCVIFIDEIDAIGKRRSDGNDSERDQTLNALLTEMSGFSQNDGIVVLAATNRADTLDSALLRPGRFDRQLEIGMPGVSAREKIIEVLLKDKPVDSEVSINELAEQTTGFSGAALESMVNEAAIYAIREGSNFISRENLRRAYISVIAGEDKKGSVISPKDKLICAVHEAGHAAAAIKLLPDEKIKRISIIPSTRGAGGYVLRNVSEQMVTKESLIRCIVIAYAGRAAEEVFLGGEKVSRGASNDIEKATEMINALAGKYGMDNECGVLSYDRNDGVLSAARRRISQKLYEQAVEFVKANKELTEKIRDLLLERESLAGEEVDELYEIGCEVETERGL